MKIVHPLPTTPDCFEYQHCADADDNYFAVYKNKQLSERTRFRTIYSMQMRGQ